MSWCSDSNWTCFLQTFSPVVVVAGIGFQAARLFYLRQRQKSALRHVCDEIAAMASFPNTGEVMLTVHRIPLLFEHYRESVFGQKTPAGLVDEFIEIATLVRAVEHAGSWDHDKLVKFRERALAIKGRCRLVLFTL